MREKDIRLLFGNNRKLSITGLPQSFITIKNLRTAAKEKFGGYMLKDFLSERLLKKLILRPGKCFTLYKSRAKDLGSSKMTNRVTLHIRNANQDDIPFLFSTYLKHNWYDKTNSTLLPKMVWINAQRKRLEKIYQENKVRVCCLAEDHELILGYAFLDADNKPFVYVKQAFRKSPENIDELLRKTIEEEQQ